MRSVLACACGLILVGLLAAGCGGGEQAAVRQESKQFLGNGNPKILRIETVRDYAGNKEVVATLEGHFGFPAATMPCSRRCRPPASYAWISFNRPGQLGGLGGTSASMISAIDNAHRADPRFGIFPYTTMTGISCAIPRGGSSGTVDGRCRTEIDGMRGGRPTSITFHEGWGFGHRADGGWTRNQRGGGWVVALDPHGHVQSVRRFGDLPPQLWR